MNVFYGQLIIFLTLCLSVLCQYLLAQGIICNLQKKATGKIKYINFETSLNEDLDKAIDRLDRIITSGRYA